MLTRTEAIERVMDVLAPRDEASNERIPIFEWGHEVTPTEAEVRALAITILDSIHH